MGYMMHFAIYLFAMVGIICLALFVVQKSVSGSFKKKTSAFLQVEDTITIAPKKSLFVINKKKKKLLIASDEGRTTFLTELNEKNNVEQLTKINPAQDIKILKTQKKDMKLTSKLAGVNMYKPKNLSKDKEIPVMRGILTKLNK